MGIVLTSALMLIFVQWGMRQSGHMETSMTSVERILEYRALETEAALETGNKDVRRRVEDMSGSIEFR